MSFFYEKRNLKPLNWHYIFHQIAAMVSASVGMCILIVIISTIGLIRAMSSNIVMLNGVDSLVVDTIPKLAQFQSSQNLYICIIFFLIGIIYLLFKIGVIYMGFTSDFCKRSMKMKTLLDV